MHAKAPALRSRAVRRPEKRHSQAAQAMGSRTSRKAQGRSKFMGVTQVDRRKRLSHFGARLPFLWGRRFRLPTCWSKRSSRHLRGNGLFTHHGRAGGESRQAEAAEEKPLGQQTGGAEKGEPGPEIEGAIQRGKETRDAAMGIGGGGGGGGAGGGGGGGG